MRIDWRIHRRRRLGVWPSLALWGLLLALAWLDTDGCLAANRAAIFGAIVSAIEWIVGVVGDIGAAVALSLESVVLWCVHSIGFLGTHLGSLFRNTGSMFAKLWEGAKIVYNDVLKPVAQWLHDAYSTIRSWLVRVFEPILQWANRVKNELLSLYRRFLRPVFDALDLTKHVLDILAALHVPFANQLDAIVTDVERALQESYLFLLRRVNEIVDTIQQIVSFDGFLQRYIFLRTMERDAFYVWRVMANHGARPTTALDREKVARAVLVRSTPENIAPIVSYLQGDVLSGYEFIDEAIKLGLEDLNST